MTPDIKLIALDMDGTLLASDHATVPQRNRNALRAAAERGVKIAVATGRSWSLAREAVEPLGFVSYAITGNGGCVVDAKTGGILVKTPMDKAQCARIIRILRRRGLPYELYIDGQNYIERTYADNSEALALSPEFLEMYRRNMVVVEDMLEVVAREGTEKFDIFYLPVEEWDDLAAELRATGPMAVTGGLPTNLEATAPGVHKGAALAALAEKLGLSPQQVMAFGDADNDRQMLAWAGWGFAMANASEPARAAARYATGSNDEGGVGMAVEQYVLGEGPVSPSSPSADGCK